ncbi:MAG: hypothetical protein ACTSUU_00950, partial [Candidatus Thorarchaeota archaeon]
HEFPSKRVRSVSPVTSLWSYYEVCNSGTDDGAFLQPHHCILLRNTDRHAPYRSGPFAVA